MYDRYVAFDDINRNQIILNDDLEATSTFDIGELFINFIELDLTSYAEFYNDLNKLYINEYSNKTQDQSISKEFLDLDRMTDFFKKYPLLKSYIINQIIDKEEEKTIEPDQLNNLFENIFSNINKFCYEDDNVKVNISDINNEDLESYFELKRLKSYAILFLKNIYFFNNITWKFVYNNNPYIKNLDDIKNNEYVKLLYDELADNSILSTLNLLPYQSYYSEAFVFCFDTEFMPELNSLSAQERYFLYCKLNPNNHINYSEISTLFLIKNSNTANIICDEYLGSNDSTFLEWCKKSLNIDIINKLEDIQLQINQVYCTDTLSNLLYVEFHKMIEHNIRVKKCKNCGKYFILKGDYLTNYCNRIPNGEKYSCRKIAAIKSRKEKLSKNPILREYEKAYKRNYARCYNSQISQEEFQSWINEATKKRTLAEKKYNKKPSEEIVNSFKSYLGNK